MHSQIEKGNGQMQTAGAVIPGAAVLSEDMEAPHFVYAFECTGPVEDQRDRYCELRDIIASKSLAGLDYSVEEAEFLAIPIEAKWDDTFHNTVLTAGKNLLLDTFFAGSSYTAAWYMGLISSVSYSAISASDTAASHAGWLEAGSTNAPTFSQSARPTIAFSTSSGGSKSTSSAVVYNITGTGTVEGAFTATIATLNATTGTFYSAGLFTAGVRNVLSGDTLNVSLTLSL